MVRLLRVVSITDLGVSVLRVLCGNTSTWRERLLLRSSWAIPDRIVPLSTITYREKKHMQRADLYGSAYLWGWKLIAVQGTDYLA